MQNPSGLREDHDLKQADLADLLHTTQQVDSRNETGMHGPSIRHLIALCHYYRVSADYILGLTQDPTPREQGAVSEIKRTEDLASVLLF